MSVFSRCSPAVTSHLLRSQRRSVCHYKLRSLSNFSVCWSLDFDIFAQLHTCEHYNLICTHWKSWTERCTFCVFFSPSSYCSLHQGVVFIRNFRTMSWFSRRAGKFLGQSGRITALNQIILYMDIKAKECFYFVVVAGSVLSSNCWLDSIVVPLYSSC